MRAVIQRVTEASVSVNGEIVSSIGKGLCVLVGISRDDTSKDVEYIIRKILNLKIFDGENEARWKKSVKDLNYDVLCVSQFTLYSVLKGNKLDFHCSMAPNESKTFYEQFLCQLKKSYMDDKIKDGIFGEKMEVKIENDGPVTIQLDSQPKNKSEEKNEDKE